ncbi:MAG: hypothetical protein MUP81_00275 [Dehalococcoidia bacterium]|nr:hypothetical protein [Dehalococcoidia bacterium]
MIDTNAVIRTYLAADAGLITLVGTPLPVRIYCPRLPENAVLPAIGFFTRGGTSSPYIPGMPAPSVQFDCWAETPIVARQVYRALYDALQGIQNVAVGSNFILSAREEVQGQDLQDLDIPNYYRVLTFFEIMVR